MSVSLHEIQLASTAPVQVIDVTARVRELVAEAGLRDGRVTLISNHTTARLSINEWEEGLTRDMVDFLNRIAPPGAAYRHDRHPVDDRPNAHSHLAGLFMSASETIPVVDSSLVLGTWQSILFIELDGPRPVRTLLAHLMGDLEG
jgi:secondary thiamine-phosphate synthase enzyme